MGDILPVRTVRLQGYGRGCARLGAGIPREYIGFAQYAVVSVASGSPQVDALCQPVARAVHRPTTASA